MENLPRKMEEKQEDFFEEIEVLSLTKDDFVEIVKAQNPNMEHSEILQTKGLNIDHEGKTIVLMRRDIFPEEYMPYLEIHEKWEAYVARKDGYNLFDKSKREFKENRDISVFDDKSRDEFYGEISVYNYDFRHEYAIYKEYKKAFKDRKLEEYHDWFMNLRLEEISGADDISKQLIINDTQIRNSIFNKIMKGGKHSFVRKDD
ncbi:hypothetical protein CL684_00235 [Candidatus Campbellbacteria bacterium]|nr:hypothetical protein [Candidatus Campbellbacteria bacterium]|tara:strand:+ start:94 stop:702 length:609 start_codon:yes stop_codon:yes gene_type:complete